MPVSAASSAGATARCASGRVRACHVPPVPRLPTAGSPPTGPGERLRPTKAPRTPPAYHSASQPWSRNQRPLSKAVLPNNSLAVSTQSHPNKPATSLLKPRHRYPIPPFDFSVRGVTSISADVHKYGLGPKGTSVVLYRNHEIRKHQFVAVTEWSGGLYVSPTVAGSRPGGLIAGAWAAMMSLGLEGYLENTRAVMEASKMIETGIKEIPELFIIGRPDMTVIAFGSNDVDIFEVNDIMSTKGWHLNPLQRPNSVHICVTLQHVPVAKDFLEDLKESVKTVKDNPGPISGGLAPVYGAAGKMPDRGLVEDLLIEFMDNSC